MTIAVFLADDHAIVREGLEHILNAQPDIEVVGQAEEGQGAVDGVARLAPDVAVLDIRMPGLGGLVAARRIRQTWPDIQVVILSMHATKEHISQAMRAGARGYVLKECAGAELVEAVRAVHAGHSYTSQKVSDRIVDSLAGPEANKPAEDPLAGLSDREREVFHLVVAGRSSAEIGEILSLSPKTVETYRSRMYRKLDVHDLTELMRFGARHKLIFVE
ncbi:MAG: response regulator transcription factor [Anaerolineae bacterium]|jgi:DNA-binding NarL/FixJ family response regulator